MILVFKLNQQYLIGLTQEPFDTNDDGRTDGQREGQSEIKGGL